MQTSNEKLGIINSQMFNKKETIIIAKNNADALFSDRVSEKVLAGMLANFEHLGYQFEKEDILKMAKMSEQTLIEQVYEPVLAAAKEARGEDVQHNLLFPNFPQTVRNLDIETLSYMRFVSYFTSVYDEYILKESPFTKGSMTSKVQQILSDMSDDVQRVKEAQERKVAKSQQKDEERVESREEKSEKSEKENIRTIHLGTIDDYYHMLNNMLSSKTSLSKYDKEIVVWALENVQRGNFMPQNIPFKENWALVATHDFKTGQYQNIDIKTLQDFERLLAALTRDKVKEMHWSQALVDSKKYFGDLTLSKKQHFINFSNHDRKALKEIFTKAIEKNHQMMLESALTRESKQFTKNVLVNHLHFTNKQKYDQIRQFIYVANAVRQIKSFYEEALNNEEYDKAAQYATKISSGFLTRNIRMLVSKSDNFQGAEATQSIIRLFEEKCQDAPMDILLSARIKTIENSSAEKQPVGFYFKKSDAVEIVPYDSTAVAMSDNTQKSLLNAIENIIHNQLATLGDIGKVYIEPGLEACPLPLVGRNDSGKNRTVATGTAIPLGEDVSVLRAALYKKGTPEDFIDFSAAFLDENYKIIQQTSWNNLKVAGPNSDKIVSYHSGDCLEIKNGVTEVIDVDLEAMKECYPKAKYVIYQALSWGKKHTMNHLEKVFVTLSGVKTVQEGLETYVGHQGVPKELFNPEEQKFKVDVTGNTYTNIPILYDVENNRAHILNIATKQKQALNLFGKQGKGYDLHFEPPASLKEYDLHFELPASAMAIENFGGTLALTAHYIKDLLPHESTSIKDLAMMNIEARNGVLVENKEEADVIFAMDREPVGENQKLVSIFDKDVITTEYMVAKVEKDDKTEKEKQKEKQIQAQDAR